MDGWMDGWMDGRVDVSMYTHIQTVDRKASATTSAKHEPRMQGSKPAPPKPCCKHPNPNPEALNPKPETLNPNPYTLNPKPSFPFVSSDMLRTTSRCRETWRPRGFGAFRVDGLRLRV